LLALGAAFFGALVGAAVVAAVILVVWGIPGVGGAADPPGQPVAGIDITTSDDIGFAEAVALKVTPSVVSIGVQQSGFNPFTGQDVTQVVGNGSGVIIRGDGYILTNDHVVAEADALIVTIGVEELAATIVGRDPSTDLAVIKVARTGLPAIEMGSSADLAVGQPVVAIGSPFGLDQSVTTGIVSALGRTSYIESAQAQLTAYTSLIQTDAAINPGNSGGALTDAQGRLIGINTLIQTGSGGVAQSAGVGFAIPIDYARTIAEELIATGVVAHPYMGISSLTISESIAARFDLPVSAGVLVDTVMSGSPAEAAGIERGDIIVAIGGTTIASVEDVFIAVRSNAVGDVVQIDIVRGEDEITLDVTLGSDSDRR
jgi:putative serine protease PepD